MNLPPKDLLLARVKPGRDSWAHSRRPDRIEAVGPGEESVWDYPRPPEVQDVTTPLRVMAGDTVLAEATGGVRVLETAGAPVYYLPPDAVRRELFEESEHVTVCEWKGAAVHYDAVVDGRRVGRAAYVYPDPFDDLGRGFAKIAGYFAFYPAKVECFLGGERAVPQPGGYYGGWVFPWVKGPIKGAPGTEGW
ncbi:MAG: DUF427 domain-containing protein [Sandaracinaceae bacterium]